MASYAGHLPITETVKMLGIFSVGAFLLRGAGCTINDLWDRDIDKMVERTRSRPLASGAITPRNALIFLGAQLSLGIILGASSLVLVVSYPLMKRITFWPQFILGLTFNWGALLGWSAMMGHCDWSVCLPLYGAGVFWTLLYDTIYAIQDMPDDRLVGVKSTAIRLYDNMKLWLSGFATANISLLVLAGVMNGQGWPYFLTVIVGAGSHFIWQIRTLDMNSGTDCAKKFVSNATVGVMVLVGITLDVVRQRVFGEEKRAEDVGDDKKDIVHIAST
ncbi:hypothetical protein SmJEL517_g00072 [Synchytrium microbalum]|uniref:Uncharacterized protein n=1 Tax=Synchytrium microbalum TaxID=1806994 RepID=A0A507CJA6_9FUNG|nr:uncharacterized protein SmJEL517_g00072 [Synchytrium microbalum]TPX38284.1 hypothetical protein SmJEL517_g00072 [Synchytrium microbalum]